MGKDSSMLTTELQQLVANLVQLNRPAVALLLPGVDEGRISMALGTSPPVSVAEWFGWCNGVASRPGQIQDDVNIIPGYNPLSIDEAVHMMADYSSDPVLGQYWIPLLGSAGGDIYAAVWNAGEDAKVAGVLVGEPTEVEFSSIEQMVSVFNGCYRDRAFFLDQIGRLAIDPARYEEVYTRVIGE